MVRSSAPFIPSSCMAAAATLRSEENSSVIAPVRNRCIQTDSSRRGRNSRGPRYASGLCKTSGQQADGRLFLRAGSVIPGCDTRAGADGGNQLRQEPWLWPYNSKPIGKRATSIAIRTHSGGEGRRPGCNSNPNRRRSRFTNRTQSRGERSAPTVATQCRAQAVARPSNSLYRNVSSKCRPARCAAVRWDSEPAKPGDNNIQL